MAKRKLPNMGIRRQRRNIQPQHTRKWTIGTLNTGTTLTLHIIAKIIATTGTNIINKITYNPTTTDPNTTNNNQTINLTVTPSTATADVEVTNTASNYTPNNGDNITLTVTVKNNRPIQHKMLQ